jgi:catechol 2,3-dioxygenase-like lactoylglutathione lyase family enzyme
MSSRAGGARLHHVAVQTADLSKARRFYETVLGCTVLKTERTRKGREIVWLRCGDCRIELYGAKTDQTLVPAWNASSVGPLALGFLVPDLDSEIARLRALDVPITKPPYEPVPGERAAMIAGPDGEEIVLLERPVGP